MTRTSRLISSVIALILVVSASVLSIPVGTTSTYTDIQRLLAANIAPAMDAISASIAAHPAEMIPP
jgi:O6-methylguanine-DNA--protein-cysteine methyltransferase